MLKQLSFPENCQPRAGTWRTAADINITSIEAKDIYRAADEPSYVSWAVPWKEQDGKLKLTFVEVSGDKRNWPPTYNFNSRDIEYYLKTLVSPDGGTTWSDTGWREDLDELWEINPDHHIRHVFQLPDGRLIRNYCHTRQGHTDRLRGLVYDPSKDVAGDFPFTGGEERQYHVKYASIWTSDDGGRSWKEIYLFEREPPFFITAIHPLRDGSIVALGAMMIVGGDADRAQGALSESKDNGSTWSEPQVIAPNEDRLNPEGVGEEADFVELDDGRLLVVWRTDAQGSCMRQLYLERDSEGNWQATPAAVNPFFVHSGYPYLWRASDGTIFYYCHRSIKYTCDDGQTWDDFASGKSYYGEMVETEPGRIVAITQKNIGDCCYPWKHDTSMLQTEFTYDRVGMMIQTNDEASGALADLSVGDCADFHVAMELKLEAAGGLAYQVNGSGYRFVALTMLANANRVPPSESTEPQNVYLQIGVASGGEVSIARKVWVGQALPGSWVELQVSRKGDYLKAAANLFPNKTSIGIYTCVEDENPQTGALSLFTNKSQGSFKNVRFAPTPEAIRDNWYRLAEEQGRQIALDAGRVT